MFSVPVPVGAVLIRPATTAEVNQIQRVLTTTWRSTYPQLQPETIAQVTTRWHSLEFLVKQITNLKYYFPIACQGEAIVGIATSAENEPGLIDVFRLYIWPESQGQGIGTQLLQAITHHYPQAQKLRVYVEVHNRPAIAFYERRGFQKLEQVTENSFDEVLTEWMMIKTL